MRWGPRTAQTDSSLQEDETMRAFDISPLLRSSIGFDHVNRLFDLANRLDDNAVSYPPYNIEKRGEDARSEEHTSELQSLMRISYAVFCLKKKNREINTHKI